jgi:hypothetical protein
MYADSAQGLLCRHLPFEKEMLWHWVRERDLVRGTLGASGVESIVEMATRFSSNPQHACIYWTSQALVSASVDYNVVEDFICLRLSKYGVLYLSWVEACNRLRQMLRPQVMFGDSFERYQVSVS